MIPAIWAPTEARAAKSASASSDVALAMATRNETLMIEWIKYAREQRLSLSFKNVPQQLLTLAKLSGLENSPYFAKVCWPDSNQT